MRVESRADMQCSVESYVFSNGLRPGQEITLSALTKVPTIDFDDGPIAVVGLIEHTMSEFETSYAYDPEGMIFSREANIQRQSSGNTTVQAIIKPSHEQAFSITSPARILANNTQPAQTGITALSFSFSQVLRGDRQLRVTACLGTGGCSAIEENTQLYIAVLYAVEGLLSPEKLTASS